MKQAQFFLATITALILFGGLPATADEDGTDRHIGVYYPQPSITESHVSRGGPIPGVSRDGRIAFVVGVATADKTLGFERPWDIFVKGNEAQKLVITAKFDGRLNTVYRVRALLADLTSTARTTPVLIEAQVQSYFTFLDYLGMLSFKRITINDGDKFSYQVDIK
jgi:hypothetical protein